MVVRRAVFTLTVATLLWICVPISGFANHLTDPPPPCCGEPSAGEEAVGGTAIGRIEVSEDILTVLEVTRLEFVGHLARSLFPGIAAELVFTRTELLASDLGSADLSLIPMETNSETLLGVQAIRLYRVSLSSVQPGEIEDLTRLFLTDGHVYVEISFQEQDHH